MKNELHLLFVNTQGRSVSMGQMLRFPMLWGRGVQSLCIVAAAILFAASTTSAAILTNGTVELVDFYKQAMSSPPDVDKFTACQISFLSSEERKRIAVLTRGSEPSRETVQCYLGARSSNNFFLAEIVGNEESLIKEVTGRVGNKVYDRSTNAIAIGKGTNEFVSVYSSKYTLVCQLLNMGLGDIDPKSVEWKDRRFTAETFSHNIRYYGELQLSNGIPFETLVYVNTHGKTNLLKIVNYKYPEPLGLFDGFPAEILIMRPDRTPKAKIIFKQVHLSIHPLEEEYFNAAGIGTVEGLSTNIYDNKIMWATRKADGKLVQVSQSAREYRGGAASPSSKKNIRLIVLITIIVITTTALIVFVKFWWLEKKQPNGKG